MRQSNLLLLGFLCATISYTHAQPCAFTYQGRLTSGGTAANGSYEMSLALYDGATNGNPVGTAQTVAPVFVSNGLFTVTLDFGAGAFRGNPRWLEIAVTVFGSDQPVTVLQPRQPITSAPYAIQAVNAANLMSPDDEAPLEIKIAGVPVLRIEPASGVFGMAPNVIAGATNNGVAAGSFGSSIAGGTANRINDSLSTIGGGLWNTNSGEYSTVGGGRGNSINPDAIYATIGGGDGNTSSGEGSTVAGGGNNTGTGGYATVGGGYGNIASGNSSTVPGGAHNRALGAFSFAAGNHAQAQHSSAFVWADSVYDGNFIPVPFPSAMTNEFAARATGGVRFITGVDTNGSNIAGVSLASGSGTWSSLSDRSAKENFTRPDSREILDKVAALPLATWNYRTQDKSVRHIGPMAQDFYAAFRVGEDERHITTVDADGVALAAIQGLNQKVDELGKELRRRDTENAQLKRSIEELRRMVLKSIDRQSE